MLVCMGTDDEGVMFYNQKLGEAAAFIANNRFNDHFVRTPDESDKVLEMLAEFSTGKEFGEMHPEYLI